jgi:hypothetical protein
LGHLLGDAGFRIWKCGSSMPSEHLAVERLHLSSSPEHAWLVAAVVSSLSVFDLISVPGDSGPTDRSSRSARATPAARPLELPVCLFAAAGIPARLRGRARVAPAPWNARGRGGVGQSEREAARRHGG